MAVFLFFCSFAKPVRVKDTAEWHMTWVVNTLQSYLGNQRLECLLVTDDRLQSDVPKHEQQPDELFSTPVALRLAADHENWTGNQLWRGAVGSSCCLKKKATYMFCIFTAIYRQCTLWEMLPETQKCRNINISCRGNARDEKERGFLLLH